MLKITGEEVNFLIYQYMEESGYKHSAFTFQNEASLGGSQYDRYQLAPGMLLLFLEKALLLLQMETHLGTEVIYIYIYIYIGRRRAKRMRPSIFTPEPPPLLIPRPEHRTTRIPRREAPAPISPRREQRGRSVVKEHSPSRRGKQANTESWREFSSHSGQ